MDQRITVLQPAPTPLPDPWQMLPHSLQLQDWPSETVDEVGLLVVDGRTDLTTARSACLEVRARSDAQLLLLVNAANLAIVHRSWGFDDFVLESADPAEVDARIRMLLLTGPSSSQIVSGPVVIDESAYTATVGRRHLDLTYTEFELLKYLVAHPGRVLSRELLLREVWGYDYLGGTRTVDVHIRRLRAKLGTEYDAHISTVRSVGYRFNPVRPAGSGEGEDLD